MVPVYLKLNVGTHSYEDAQEKIKATFDEIIQLLEQTKVNGNHDQKLEILRSYKIVTAFKI